MKRIRITLALVLLVSALFVVAIAFSGTPALAMRSAQAATSTPAATGTPSADSQTQVYVTLLPSASGPTRLIIVRLKADGSVELVTDPLGADPAVSQIGTWKASGGSVTLNLTSTGTTTLPKPVTIVFKQETDRLVATEYDKTLFGDKGLTLYLRDTVEAKITEMKRAYVTVDLAAGFPLDPFLVSVNGGGELDASIFGENCRGYIDDNPTVVVHWSGKADLVRVFTFSDSDPALVIQTPDGKFLCGDDASSLVLDTQLEIANPPAGTYSIWVGSGRPKQLLPTLLVLTARSDTSLANFQLGNLVKRPPLAPSASQLPHALQAKVITEAIGRYKGTIGGPLGAAPLTQPVSAAGTIPAFDIDLGGAACNGFIADTPNYVFDVSSAVDQFTVLFDGKQDSTLLVVGPDGKAACNDDSAAGKNTNPAVVVPKPQQGRYAVFVGRLNQDTPVDGTVTVTTDPKAAPQVLAPSK